MKTTLAAILLAACFSVKAQEPPLPLPPPPDPTTATLHQFQSVLARMQIEREKLLSDMADLRSNGMTPEVIQRIADAATPAVVARVDRSIDQLQHRVADIQASQTESEARIAGVVAERIRANSIFTSLQKHVGDNKLLDSVASLLAALVARLFIQAYTRAKKLAGTKGELVANALLHLVGVDPTEKKHTVSETQPSSQPSRPTA